MSISKAELKRREQVKAEAKEYLLTSVNLVPGSEVYTLTTYVRNTRLVTVLVAHHNKILDITGAVADLLGYKTGGPLRIGGIGFNAGFHVVYHMGAALYPDGFYCPGKEVCRSCDHFNGDRDYSSDHHHTDGGYVFSHISL